MEGIIKRIVEKLRASSGAIMVVDREAAILRCGASYNMPEAWVRLTNPLEKSSGSNVNGRVAVSGRGEIHNGISIEFHGHPIESVIIVPVLQGNRVVANVEVISDESGFKFGQSDLKYIEEVAQEELSDLF